MTDDYASYAVSDMIREHKRDEHEREMERMREAQLARIVKNQDPYWTIVLQDMEREAVEDAREWAELERKWAIRSARLEGEEEDLKQASQDWVLKGRQQRANNTVEDRRARMKAKDRAKNKHPGKKVQNRVCKETRKREMMHMAMS